MEQTPIPPLVSDDRIKGYRDGMKLTELWEAVPMTGSEVRRIYEADRLKTREVVQALVNMIHHRYMDHPADTLANAKYYASGGLSTVDALALAKSTLNIKPKQ
jgi:hypothetical protein